MTNEKESLPVPLAALRRTPGDEARRIPALDGLRGVAVVLVIIGHYIHWIALGSLGVAIFYVLSGFLITGLLVAEHDQRGTISLRAFYARRTLRIMPAAYVFLAVAWLVLRGTPDNPPVGAWLASLFYYADYWVAVHVQRANQIGHTWSLAIEEQFYLIWPLLLLSMLKGGVRSFRGVRTFLVVLILLVWVWRLVLTYVLGVHPHYLQFAFDTRADYLAVGCLLALSRGTGPFRTVTESARSYPAFALGTAFALALLTFTLSSTRSYALSYPVEVVLIGLLMTQLMGATTSPLWRWLDHPAARWLGALSYSLYLYHMLARYAAGHLVAGPTRQGLLAVLLALPLAMLSYYGVERPALRWRARRFPAPQAATARTHGNLGPAAANVEPQRQLAR
ncbi:MAG: acyltransferase family protein [Woeseiaceae bacterium]